ncbi:hypothetical protein KW792_01755 [Candidatus Saccharibacteria bacterium]|nr:hypothetical protein [Candidatus Saccharibacteria bacterium]
MVKIDGVENPLRWVAEHDVPPVSEHGIDELLTWVDKMEATAKDIGAAPYASRPENVASRRSLEEKAQLITYVLKCAFGGPTSEEPDYFKIRLAAIREERAQSAQETNHDV